MNNRENLKILSVAAILRTVGIVLISFSVLMTIVTIVGNLLITVNPDTGESINGVGNIILSILRDWQFILLFVVGAICLSLSRRALKKNNTHSESGAKIITMEEVKDTTHENVSLNLEEENKIQTDEYSKK